MYITEFKMYEPITFNLTIGNYFYCDIVYTCTCLYLEKNDLSVSLQGGGGVKMSGFWLTSIKNGPIHIYPISQ